MMWFTAILIGATIALAYCAGLWFAIPAITSSRALIWFGLTSLARLGLVGSLFAVLAMLAPEIAVWALVGFAMAHLGVAYWMGGNPHGR